MKKMNENRMRQIDGGFWGALALGGATLLYVFWPYRTAR